MAEHEIERDVRRMARPRSIGGASWRRARLIGGGSVPRGLHAAARPAQPAPSAARRRAPAGGAAVRARHRRQPGASLRDRGRAVHVQLGRLRRPGEHRGVQGALRHRRVHVRRLSTTTRCSSPSSQGGATGLYDIAAARPPSTSRAWSSEGFIVQARHVAGIPNAAVHQPDVQELLDPAGPGKYNNYQIPKDWGTTGIAVRKKFVTEDIRDLEAVLRGGRAQVLGQDRVRRLDGRRADGSRSRCSATRSTRSTRPSSNAARELLLEARPARARARLRHVRRQDAHGGGRPGPRLDRPLGQELGREGDRRRRLRRPGGGDAVLDGHLGHARRRAPSRSGLRVAQLHPRAGDPGQGDEPTATPRRTTRPRSSSIPSDPRQPGDLPAGRRHRQPRRRPGHVGQHPAHRDLGGVQARPSAADRPRF